MELIARQALVSGSSDLEAFTDCAGAARAPHKNAGCSMGAQM
jgi:hypothetical protein